MIIHLVPIGKERFELYGEPPEEPSDGPPDGAGLLRRWTQTAGVHWHALVDAARHGHSAGPLTRWRHALVRRLAENIAEQRTLRGLRGRSSVTLRYPSTVDAATAKAMLNAALAQGRRHHARWLAVDVILFIGSGALALVPGPNLIAYYFLFRLVGHLQSWRGACDGLAKASWTLEANQSLAELAALVDVPRAARQSRVEAIAARLNLPQLSAFFDRTAASSS